MPSGRFGAPFSNGMEPFSILPLQPMSQFAEPGGIWFKNDLAVQFQATAQPIAQPWPEPISPRFINSIPPLGTWQLSTNKPVAQRWCGCIQPPPLNTQLSNTMGPEMRG